MRCIVPVNTSACLSSKDELVNASSLPCFTTDYGQLLRDPYAGRVNIPVTDPETNVTFYVKDRRSFKTDKNMEVWNETEECVNCCERY